MGNGCGLIFLFWKVLGNNNYRFFKFQILIFTIFFGLLIFVEQWNILCHKINVKNDFPKTFSVFWQHKQHVLQTEEKSFREKNFFVSKCRFDVSGNKMQPSEMKMQFVRKISFWNCKENYYIDKFSSGFQHLYIIILKQFSSLKETNYFLKAFFSCFWNFH